MAERQFSGKDLEQIQSHGLTVKTVEEQIRKFRKGTPYLNLDRPCKPGDGIQKLEGGMAEKCLEAYRSKALDRQLLKFVPASGAATRMFKTLIKVNNNYSRIRASEVAAGLTEDTGENKEIIEFTNNLHKFAFFPDLEKALAREGMNAGELLKQGEYKPFLDYLLTDKGLHYGSKPKGLLKFHAYPEETRTAFEEHLVEAAGYSRSAAGDCRLHFTVSPSHQAGFEKLFEQVAASYESRLESRFKADFSVQPPSTDTIAVDMADQPFRRSDGSLLFRPGGHGALLENLNRLATDIVFIKNIDNVVHDRFKPETIEKKQILCGYLMILQEKIFTYIEALAQNPPDESLTKEVANFAATELCAPPPESFYTEEPENRRRYLLDQLNRPLRVCGMVPNSGEPGGGPFWVRGRDGRLSIQIVETSQIDPEDERQQSIQKALSHFNPVDLVCAPLDVNRQPFDLNRFVDPEAVFIAYKSEDGRDLKALEHPGLWNGAMALWNTVFVEVPLITFNPVKRVNDLLREPHQPD